MCHASKPFSGHCQVLIVVEVTVLLHSSKPANLISDAGEMREQTREMLEQEEREAEIHLVSSNFTPVVAAPMWTD